MRKMSQLRILFCSLLLPKRRGRGNRSHSQGWEPPTEEGRAGEKIVRQLGSMACQGEQGEKRMSCLDIMSKEQVPVKCHLLDAGNSISLSGSGVTTAELLCSVMHIRKDIGK